MKMLLPQLLLLVLAVSATAMDESLAPRGSPDGEGYNDGYDGTPGNVRKTYRVLSLENLLIKI